MPIPARFSSLPSFAHLGLATLRGLALAWLVGIALAAMLADFLASPLPFRAELKGQVHYPWFQPQDSAWLVERTQPDQLQRLPAGQGHWLIQPLEDASWPLVPFSPRGAEVDRPHLPPGTPYQRTQLGWVGQEPQRFVHWLGTDEVGHDVAALLIHGARHALWPAVLGGSLAWLLGLIIGTLAGWGQGLRYQLAPWPGGVWLLGLLAIWFWGWRTRPGLWAETPAERETLGLGLGLSVALLLLTYGLGRWVGRWPQRRWELPLGQTLDRALEVLDALPPLLLLLGVFALLGEGLSRWQAMVVLGLVGWVGMARLVRGQVMSLAERPFIEAARVSGASPWRIAWRHLLPNVWTSLTVVWVAGVGNLLLAESTLSFLKLIAADQESWGSLMASVQVHKTAWWLVIPPGLAIFFTVFSLNVLAEWLQATWVVEGKRPFSKARRVRPEES